jgi:fatty acid desaturase
MLSDFELKRLIRRELPAEALINHPWRLLWAVPLVSLITALSVTVVMAPLAWYSALALSLLIGGLYASLFFWGHELAHGSMIRARSAQDILLFFPFLIYCLSPQLWRVWHHHAHHANTNIEGRDPDNFGTIEEFHRNTGSQFMAKFAPGSKHLLSAAYLFSFFMLQAWGVLWRKSKAKDFKHLNRTRAQIETLAMVAFWLTVMAWAGPVGAFFAVIIPAAVANFVILSYIITNHMMRPLTEHRDTLTTTMSVTTWKWLDKLHFHFSHHVEHHLFPAMATCYAPLVRQQLECIAGERYLAPPHAKALLMMFKTPRIYDGLDTLMNPYREDRIAIAQVEERLRGREASARTAQDLGARALNEGEFSRG